MALGEILRGDLGVSFQSAQSVGDLLRTVAPNTLALAAAAFGLTVPLTLALCLAPPWRRGRLAHRTFPLHAPG